MGTKTNYLMKYRGKYKVLANFDLNTGNIPRDENGNIDDSYDDIYIALQKDGQIYYIGKDGRGKYRLECLIPSITRGHNLLRNMYENLILKRECNEYERDNYERMYINLIKNNILLNVNEDDSEIFFQFYDFNFDMIIDYLKPVKGTKTSPFSSKYTKKKINYVIPDDDLQLYNNVTNSKITKDNMFVVNRINREFDEVIVSKLSNKNNIFDIKADKKISGLNGRNYYHHLGNNIWNSYIEYINSHIDKYINEI